MISACTPTSLHSSIVSIACALGIWLATSTSYAQPYIGTGVFSWEGSADGGDTWASSNLELPATQASILVRARVTWAGIDGRQLLFAASRFDGIWASAAGGGLQDVADTFTAMVNFMQPPTQRLNGQRQGDILKIDDSRDTSAPGAGDRWLIPGQQVDFGIPNYSNPITIFQFRIVLDGTAGVRSMTSLFSSVPQSPDSNATDRFMLVWDGAPFRPFLPLMTFQPLRVNVIPTPGALACVLSGVALLPRRRRVESR